MKAEVFGVFGWLFLVSSEQAYNAIQRVPTAIPGYNKIQNTSGGPLALGEYPQDNTRVTEFATGPDVSGCSGRTGIPSDFPVF